MENFTNPATGLYGDVPTLAFARDQITRVNHFAQEHIATVDQMGKQNQLQHKSQQIQLASALKVFV